VNKIKNILFFGSSSAIAQAMVTDFLGRKNTESMHLVSRKKIEHPNPKVSCLMQEPGEKGFKKAVDDAFADHGHFDLIIQFAGVLHGEGLKPEKSLRDCSRENLLRSFERNTLPFVFLSKYLRPHLRKSDFTRIVALSARVGSIEDNRKGGWYGYRMSKAALNMAVKNISIEFGNYNCNAAVAALHPGKFFDWDGGTIPW